MLAGWSRYKTFGIKTYRKRGPRRTEDENPEEQHSSGTLASSLCSNSQESYKGNDKERLESRSPKEPFASTALLAENGSNKRPDSEKRGSSTRADRSNRWLQSNINLEDGRHVVEDHVDTHEICDADENHTITDTSSSLSLRLINEEVRKSQSLVDFLLQLIFNLAKDFGGHSIVVVDLLEDLLRLLGTVLEKIPAGRIGVGIDKDDTEKREDDLHGDGESPDILALSVGEAEVDPVGHCSSGAGEAHENSDEGSTLLDGSGGFSNVYRPSGDDETVTHTLCID